MTRRYHCLGSRPDGTISANALGHMDNCLLTFKSTPLAFHICVILLGLCLHRYYLRSDHIVMTSRELQPSLVTEPLTPFLNLNAQKKKTTKEMKAWLELTRYSLRQRDSIKSSQYLKPCAEMFEDYFLDWHFD